MSKRMVLLLMMLTAGALVMPAVSQAALIGHCGPVTSEPTQLGFCNKTVVLSGSILTITLENTSPLGGFIVADAFDLPAGVTASLSSASNTNFNFFGGTSINVQPFGSRNQVLTLADNLNSPFEGAGGNPNDGIAVGDGPASFVFTLSGLGATEESIVGSEVIRFKGFDNGGSDKTLISLDGGNPPGGPVPIPEPTTLLLMGSGLTGVAHVMLRRRRRSS
jgi:hypothetical protein